MIHDVHVASLNINNVAIAMVLTYVYTNCSPRGWVFLKLKVSVLFIFIGVLNYII